MSLRRVLVAGVAALAVGLGGVPVHAADDPLIATAGFGLRGDARSGFVVWFTARRDFPASTARLELVSEVFKCSYVDGQCALVAQQIDVLPYTSMVVRPDLTATLRTVWAGKPLTIDWRPGGRDRGSTTGHDYTFAQTNHTESMIEYRGLWAVSRATRLLGGSRGCVDRLATTMTARLAVGEDLTMAANQPRRAEAVGGLAAQRGRCFIES